MKAIVLAGGFATRLRPLTLTKPKPLLPILDKPLLDWIIEGLVRSDVTDIVISIRYLADAIKKRYSTGIDYGADIRYAEEVRPLGDAGPIQLVNQLYGLDSSFLVIYGDVFSNIDYRKLVDFHRKKGGLATMVLTRVEDPSRYGVAVIDDDCRVVNFVEKPPKEEVLSNMVNAGVYVFEPEVLKYIPSEPSKLAKDVIPKLVNDGVIYAYIHEGIWSDIGLPSDYLRANFEALRHFFPTGYTSDTSSVNGAEIIQPTYVSAEVELSSTCKVGPYVVIGRGSKVGPAVRIKYSLLFNNVLVDEGSLINYSIIGEHSLIGKWVRIEPYSVIGDEVIIKDELLISKRTVILPFKEVESGTEKEGEILL